VFLLVEVVVEGLDRPPVGAPLRLEVRDTSLADVEAPLVAETRAEVAAGQSSRLQTVELEIPDASVDPRGRLTVFAHVDVDADDALGAGDFITTQSYPVPDAAPGGEARLQVAVVRI
jgi:uncharacterized lipoprotein YbaY